MILIDSTASRDAAAKRHSGSHSQRLRRRILTLLVVSPLLMTSTLLGSARAGGLYVNEFSTTSQANAGAGRVRSMKSQRKSVLSAGPKSSGFVSTR